MTERRFLQTTVTASAGVLRGRLVYNSDSGEIRSGGKTFIERIAPGAFTKSLAGRREVILTAGHASDDPLNCIGRWPSGGLVLLDTSGGLDWSAKLPDTGAGRDLHKLVTAGVIKGASFEFIANAETWSKRDGRDMRTITAATLLEINPVAYPAYEANTIEARRRSSDYAPVGGSRFPERDYWAARFGISTS